MKMLLIICPEERQHAIRELIARHGVHAYTEIPRVIGEGATGRKLGTHVSPDTSVAVFTVIPDEKKDELIAALKDCASTLFPAEGLKAFVLPVEEVV